MNEENHLGAQETPAKPPLFNTWNGMYLFVLALHAVVIAALYILTLNYQ